MADIIQLLPDSIANQIAAGEVIQRPASIVKELLENALDAGAQNIHLHIKDGGKAMVQVVDDGAGMSQTDARMAFERHATSKIRNADDLFSLKSMGFRGEALASVASVAQVELKTRTESMEIGTRILIEGSEVKDQSPCQTPKGTVMTIKNLFYNVPARKKFLKSKQVEMKHILDEFQRIALAHPTIFFSLKSDNTEIYHLTKTNLRQRIVAVLGSKTNEKLVPIEEKTDVVSFEGFIGKPASAKKNRSEQFFFVNGRFIKSTYLSHAIKVAYDNLLLQDQHPLFVIFIEIDPSRIDVNVHPTKQEIKFDDERLIYNYLQATVKHALGQYAVTPTLDFEQEIAFSAFKTAIHPGRSQPERSHEGQDKGRPISSPSFSSKKPSSDSSEKEQLQNWKMLYEGLEDQSPISPPSDDQMITVESNWDMETEMPAEKKQVSPPFQIHNTYIVSQLRDGFLMIDQKLAHERILYEKYLAIFDDRKSAIQQQLFPQTIHLSTANATLLQEIMNEILSLGFDLTYIGQDSFMLNGLPADYKSDGNESQLIEDLLEDFQENRDLKLDSKHKIAYALAKNAAIARAKRLSEAEMREITDQLFACENPNTSPSGKKCFIRYDLESIAKQFG